jgi:hypothetical protein
MFTLKSTRTDHPNTRRNQTARQLQKVTEDQAESNILASA